MKSLTRKLSPVIVSKKATIFRMVTPDHLCPWGIKSKDLLKRNGYEVEDHLLETKEEVENYKKENGYDKTPQILIEGENIGGYDQLREHLGLGPDPKEGGTYQPVVAVFAVTFPMALTTCWAIEGGLEIFRTLELFIAFSMCVLGILKLRDLMSFATGFVKYDLVARHYVPIPMYIPTSRRVPVIRRSKWDSPPR